MGEPSEFSLLGNALDALARKREVAGPEAISEHVWTKVRYDASDMTILEYLHGYDRPPSEFMVAFRDAFKLTEKEAEDLAWIYAFHKPPPST
jgi:hypothetical protein